MRLVTKLAYDLKHRGIAFTIRFYSFLFWSLLKYPYYCFKRDFFTFNGERFHCWYHYYNITYTGGP